LALSGCASEAVLRERFDALSTEFASKAGHAVADAIFKLARSAVVMRSRYVEEELDRAIEHGVSQYVILGAGLDSFAYRKPGVTNALRVFEVDYPATQAWKRTRLQELDLATPSNLAFVSLDFQKDSLIERLRNSGYRPDAMGFFSWLGVTLYLTRDAIFDTLRKVASLARGTEIIFEYELADALLDDEAREVRKLLMDEAAARGEPQFSFFEPAELAQQVRRLGFAEVRDFGREEANARYFSGRADGLRLRSAHFMGARA
jgi:methyltransferase (TIGR00027 family)